MKNYTPTGRSPAKLAGLLAVAATAGLLLRTGFGEPSVPKSPAPAPVPAGQTSSAPTPDAAAVTLTADQLAAIKLAPVGTHEFPLEKDAVGSIDYDEDLAVPVSTPYPGKIIATFAKLGDDVRKGQPLYTIDSPDLVQAESTLIGAAAAFALTSKELARARSLFGTNGVSEREVEQATADAQTAEGALKAARDSVRVFGKSEPEIDAAIATRQIDHTLLVSSPINGRITARNAQPGLLVQPGITPAPYSVADLSSKWMLASVTETDSAMFRPGQRARATLMAHPGRTFEGQIARLGSSVDPTTHRLTLRVELPDPQDELRPGMLANFTIVVKEPATATAVPLAAVVRNGDGTMNAWVTTDHKRFVQRPVKVGLQHAGNYQILEGLKPGEQAVTEGAVFLANILFGPPAD